MRFKTVIEQKESTYSWDKGKVLTWYYLYAQKYWFSFIWRKCGIGSLNEEEHIEKIKKYKSGEYEISDLAITNWIKKLPHTFESIYLCLKYPFLWPRNRFSGLHYSNWKFQNYIKDIKNKAYLYTGKIGDKTDPYRIEVANKWYVVWYNIINWIYMNPVQWVHCIPDHTELDAMEKGWKKAFGLQLCEEIKQSLLKTGGRKLLRSYRITQIKEKWGYLHWYDAYTTDDIQRIISKYEDISEHTCIVCGEQAKYKTTSWISPYCEDHLPRNDKIRNSFKLIDSTDDESDCIF